MAARRAKVASAMTRAAAFAALAAFVLLVLPAAAQDACKLTALGTGTLAPVRDGRTGLWADPNFAPLPPDNLARLRAERGRFTIIEGKVLSVRDSGSTIYVNFGARWSQGFSVIILRRNQRIFNAAGVEPKRLEGRRIR